MARAPRHSYALEAMHRLRRSLALALVAGLAVSAAAASPAHAADPRCPKHRNELSRTGGGVLWTSNGSGHAGSLYVCTAYYGDPAVSRRLGPWSAQSKQAFDGSTVIWTVRRTGKDGVREDVVYAADGPYGNWLSGVRPTTGPTSAIDRKVSRLAANGPAIAWVTTKGSVMLSVQQPDTWDTTPIGAGTPGAAAPVVPGVTDVPGITADNVLAYPQGLVSPLGPQGRRLLVGRWAALAGPAFSDTLRLKFREGDGDECGGASFYDLTVRPIAGQPRVGAGWGSSWGSNSVACTS